MNASTVDTNVVLYLAGLDPQKAAVARQVLSSATPLSVQVLNEVTSVFIRKWKWSWAETEEFLALVRDLAVIHPMTERTHDLGRSLARRYQLNIYDGLIVAAALIAGCDTLYTEDMQHGLVVDNRLRLVNPFA